MGCRAEKILHSTNKKTWKGEREEKRERGQKTWIVVIECAGRRAGTSLPEILVYRAMKTTVCHHSQKTELLQLINEDNLFISDVN